MTENLAPRALNFFPSKKFDPHTGYGKFELSVYNALIEQGATVYLPESSEWGTAEHTLLVGNPSWIPYADIPGKVWLWTMIETNTLSQKWIKLINDNCAGVLVSAPDMVKIFETCGVTCPVYFVPLGVDYYVPELVKRVKSEPFIFLSYTYGDMRKAAELVLLAFNRIFGGSKDFRLILKTRGEGHWVRGLVHDQIDVIDEKLPEAEWQALLARAHCMVFPSRGEGFGLPPREATLAGMPAIATQWMGMYDVEFWGYPLPVKELRPAIFDEWDANEEGSLWAEPDSHVMMELMLHVYNNYDEALKVAERGREYLLKHHRWNDLARHALQMMGVEREPVK